MADLAQLEKALVNADAAGDAEAATLLAGEIKRVRSSPPQEPSLARAGMGGVNRGIAGLLGMPVDTVENVLNLGRAGIGSIATAMGRPDIAPDVQRGSVGGSEWIAGLMEKMGINASNPNPQDTASQMAFRAGTIAPSALIPGATAKQTALAAGGAAVGEQMGGNEGAVIGAMAPAAASRMYAGTRGQALEARKAANTVQDEIAAKARDEGLTIPPVQTNPASVTNQVLQGLVSGKARTEMIASNKNQPVIDAIAKRELGLPPKAELTPESLVKVRDDAGKAYQAVKDFGSQYNLQMKPDAQFKGDIKSLGGDYQSIIDKFPAVAKNASIDDLKAALSGKTISPLEAVELTKKLRHDAAKNYKAFDDPEKAALATAQKQAANAIEGLLERTLSKSGQAQLLSDFRSARQTIAKSYDVESALVGGHVDAQVFARAARKEKYLSGGLKTIADTASEFKSAMRTPNPANAQQFALWDSFAGGVGGMALGSPWLTAGVPAARFGARELILSQPYQRSLGTASYEPLLVPDSGLAALLRGNLAGNMTQ